MQRLRQARPGEVNFHVVDRFTLVHAAIGAFYGVCNVPLAGAIVLALAWELVENPLKAHAPFIFPHATKDTLRNAAGDVLAVLCGWLALQALRGW